MLRNPFTQTTFICRQWWCHVFSLILILQWWRWTNTSAAIFVFNCLQWTECGRTGHPGATAFIRFARGTYAVSSWAAVRLGTVSVSIELITDPSAVETPWRTDGSAMMSLTVTVGHTSLSFYVQVLINIMHLQTPATNINHHNYRPDSNFLLLRSW